MLPPDRLFAADPSSRAVPSIHARHDMARRIDCAFLARQVAEHRFPGAFHDAALLESDTDMLAPFEAVLEEENRKNAQGRADWSIPMRCDRGHEISDDGDHAPQIGHPLIGRLRGMVGLRGVAIELGATCDD